MGMSSRRWRYYLDDLRHEGTRWTLARLQNSPYLYSRDTQAPRGAVVRKSCKPYEHDNEEHVKIVVQAIKSVGDQEWVGVNFELATADEDAPLSWQDIRRLCQENWPTRMKESTTGQYYGMIDCLEEEAVSRRFKSIKSWILKKKLGSSSCRNRLDFVSQVRKTLTLSNKERREPPWLPEKDIAELRSLHNKEKEGNTLIKTTVRRIRGIPTKKEAEEYFDAHYEKYPLDIWCLIMFMLYGLRNHEVWWVSEITEEDSEKGILPGWVWVPGNWRTKSIRDHYVWPLYPEWIEKYDLKQVHRKNQLLLHEVRKPKIVSEHDPTKIWNPADEHKDRGVCVNNRALGDWIGSRLRHVKGLVGWEATVPDARGQYVHGEEKERISCYDLRHTWAISVATLPQFGNVTTEQAAEAMGHDVATHIKHYQHWVSKDDYRRRVMGSIDLRAADES